MPSKLALFGTALRIAAAPMGLLPLRRRVAMVSRQSSKLSRDYELLRDELATLDPTLEVAVALTEPETKGIAPFAAAMLRQLWLTRTSRVTVTDGYNPVVSIPARRQGTTVFELWHAVGAVKRFGYQCLDTPAGRTSADARDGRMHQGYDVIVAGGPGAKDAYAEAFGYLQIAIAPLGLPHMDDLYSLADPAARLAAAEQLTARHPWMANGRTTVLYAPTLRKGPGYDGWLERYVTALAKACPTDAVNLVVAAHPLSGRVSNDLLDAHPFVHQLARRTAELYCVADVVVTDYSAVALEAGLAGVPALFYVPDVEAYRSSPGLNIDPVTDPLLFGTTDAAELMAHVTDAGLLAQHAGDYLAFVADYFKGVGPGATARVAREVLAAAGN